MFRSPADPDRRVFLRRFLAAGAFTLLGAGPGWAADNRTRYTVRAGDTLSEIAQDFGVTVRDLKRVNNLKGDLIRVGQELIIPRTTDVGSDALGPVRAVQGQIRLDRRKWRYIVTHHSAIENGNAAIYGAAHKRRGMENGLAYHFVIGNGIDSGDGEIEVGPRWLGQLNGGHVRRSDVNAAGIGICLVGNLENHRPTPRQQAALFQLIDHLKQNAVSGKPEISVHKWIDRNHTVCPGKYFPYEAYSQRYR
jgi:murein DD-endopeptidase MepM/ murein hydrolase activator NlpD